jgi:subfamily B ATP-binding cassette protein MsbA
MISVLSETVNGIRAVKMFNMNERENEKFDAENRKFTRSDTHAYTIRILSSPLTETLGVAVAVALLWYAGREVLSGKGFSAEDFVRYLVLLVASYQPFKRLAAVNSSVQTGLAAAERVDELFETPIEQLASLKGATAPDFEKEIRFDAVRFTYPQCDDEVLKGIDFAIKKGDIVAIVGSSGSGKSTILDLLPRFYDITGGSITIDGVDARTFDLAGLRRLFGIVSQETVLFNDTISNNISYGAEHASADAVRQAAEAANALEFIEHLPDGMNTVIGEKGELLSGGQRQRIAIARALLRNPPVLILDEATSSLDTESERLVQGAINVLMANRTVLVVAHRLSTILPADSILVLEDGAIVERGTHKELLEMGGRYSQLYDMQFEVAS